MKFHLTAVAASPRPDDEGGLSYEQYSRHLDGVDDRVKKAAALLKEHFKAAKFDHVKVSTPRRFSSTDLSVYGDIYFHKDRKKHKLSISMRNDRVDLFLDGNYFKLPAYVNHIKDLPKKEKILIFLGTELYGTSAMSPTNFVVDLTKNLKKLIKIVKLYL